MQKLMMTGTGGDADYLVVAVKDGVALGVKVLGGVIKFNTDTMMGMGIFGVRIRAQMLHEDWEGIPAPSMAPDNVGQLAMKAFPLLKFIKCDAVRASMEMTSVAKVSLDYLQKDLIRPEYHEEFMAGGLAKIMADVEEPDVVMPMSELAGLLADTAADLYKKALADIEKNHDVKLSGVTKVIKHEGNVATVDFGKGKDK